TRSPSPTPTISPSSASRLRAPGFAIGRGARFSPIAPTPTPMAQHVISKRYAESLRRDPAEATKEIREHIERAESKIKTLQLVARAAFPEGALVTWRDHDGATRTGRVRSVVAHTYPVVLVLENVDTGKVRRVDLGSYSKVERIT